MPTLPQVADRIRVGGPANAARTAGGGASDTLTNRSIRRRVLREMLRAACAQSHRVDQLAAQQVQRRSVVEHDVVERIGDDLGDPYQSGLHILMKNSCTVRNSSAPKPTTSQIMPTCAHELSRGARDAGNSPNRVGSNHSTPGDSAQIDQQHDLAPQVVADLDVFLVLVGGLVDLRRSPWARRRSDRPGG